MKKLLSLVLSIIMMVSVCFSVSAYSDVKEGTYVSEAVTVLSGLDILNGYEDGTFKPEDTVTRAEMAKIICEMLGYNQMGTNKTPFNDVEPKHWASGYINSAYTLGIINGYGNGNFGPEDTVTYEQAAKMIVCALGYSPLCNSYPSSYLAQAATLKLFDKVKGNGDVPATREDIAVLVYNALDAAMLIQVGFGDNDRYEVSKEDTLLNTKLDIAKVTGTIASIDFKKNEARVDITKVDKAFADIESGVYKTLFDLSDFKNLVSTIYIDVEDESEPVIVAIVSKGKADIVTISDKELYVSYADNKFEYYEDIDDSKTSTIELAEDFKAYVNSGSKLVDLSDYINDFDSIKFVDADGDGVYETATIEVIKSFVVKSVNVRTNTIVVDRTAGYSFNKAKLVLDENTDDTYVIDTAIEDIEVGDVINIKESDMSKNTHYEIYVTNETIKGYVNSKKGDSYYINGKEYHLVNNVEVDLGTTGIFTLDMKGNIIAVDTTETKTSVKWGYLLKTDNDSNAFEDEYLAQIIDVKGNKEIYNFAEKVRLDDATTLIKIEDIFEDIDTGLVGYKLNSKNEISVIYTDVTEIDSDYRIASGLLKVKSDGRLGSYYPSDNAIIFSIDNDDDVTIQPSTGLLPDGEYDIVELVYDSSTNDIVIAVGNNVIAAADPTSPVMLVKSVAHGLEDMIIVTGYVDGELVEFKYDAYELDTDEIKEGDLLQYTLSGDEAVGISNLGNVTVGTDWYYTKNGNIDFTKEAEKFEGQDDGLFVHYGTVTNIRGVNVEFKARDIAVSMPGDFPVYRYSANGRIYTNTLIDDIEIEYDNEATSERLVVVKYDNVPLIAVIVELD